MDGLDGAVSATVSPDGAHVYATGFRDDAVAVFRRDPGNGALTFLHAVRDGVAGMTDLGSARSATLSPDGARLYVSSAGDNAVTVLRRDPASGALTFLEAFRGGALPGELALSPDGHSLYVSSHLDHSITILHQVRCGDGLLDPGEPCDDGNGVDGDCCSAVCTVEPAGTVCRAAVGPCDVADTCDGATPQCLADHVSAAGTACGDDGNSCTDDVCDGAGTCAHPRAPGFEGLSCALYGAAAARTCGAAKPERALERRIDRALTSAATLINAATVAKPKARKRRLARARRTLRNAARRLARHRRTDCSRALRVLVDQLMVDLEASRV